MINRLTPEQEAAAKRMRDNWQRVNKLSAYAIIESVFEIHEKTNYRKIDPKGGNEPDNISYDTISLGWHIRVNGSSAIFVGLVKPPEHFAKGATVKISVEVHTPTTNVEAVSEPPPDAHPRQIHPSMPLDERELAVAVNVAEQSKIG